LIDAISLQRFKEQLKEERIIDSQGRTLSVFGKKYAFKVIQIERGGRLMVIYTHGEEDRDAVYQKLYEICRKVRVSCRIRFRRAGRYWQDMFPELWGKSLTGYKPFYRDFFEFRKKVESLSEKELKKKVLEEIRRLELSCF